jgi:hypothetical protein
LKEIFQATYLKSKKSKQNRLKSAIPIGAELRGITQIFKTAILFQKKEPEYNSGVLNPCRNKGTNKSLFV